MGDFFMVDNDFTEIEPDMIDDVEKTLNSGFSIIFPQDFPSFAMICWREESQETFSSPSTCTLET